jgi:four helix bundle protein
MKDERYDYHHNAITDMMERKPNILLEKSEAFAGRIVKMYQYLTTKRNEHTLSKQILRSGTSIGANLAEAKNAQSVRDYINKQNIALKEADETVFWIKNLHQGGYLNEKEYMSIYNDCNELVKMLVSSVKTLKNKNGIP